MTDQEKIAALESELAEARSGALAQRAVVVCNDLVRLDKERREWMAHANALRDALESITSTADEARDSNTPEFMEYLSDRIGDAKRVWSAHPADSLAAHNAQVIERLFPTPSESDKQGGWTISTDWLQRISAATVAREDEESASMEQVCNVLEVIRTLAAQEVKP